MGQQAKHSGHTGGQLWLALCEVAFPSRKRRSSRISGSKGLNGEVDKAGHPAVFFVTIRFGRSGEHRSRSVTGR